MCRPQRRGRNTNPWTRFYENYLKNAKKTSELDQLHFSQKLGINRKNVSPKSSLSEAVQHIWPCNLLSWCNCTCTCLSWYLLMIFFEKFIIFLFHYFTVNLFFHLYLHLSLLSPAADCCFRIWHFFPNMGEESELTWDSVDFLCINYLIFVTNIKYICVIDICHKYVYTNMIFVTNIFIQIWYLSQISSTYV